MNSLVMSPFRLFQRTSSEDPVTSVVNWGITPIYALRQFAGGVGDMGMPNLAVLNPSQQRIRHQWPATLLLIPSRRESLP